jgi:hypothetical protein
VGTNRIKGFRLILEALFCFHLSMSVHVGIGNAELVRNKIYVLLTCCRCVLVQRDSMRRAL